MPRAPRGSTAWAVGLLVASNILWGASWVVAKLALRDLSVMQIAAWRMILAGVVLLPVTVWFVRRGRLPWRAWPMVCVLSAIGAVLAKLCNLWGLDHASAANAGILMTVEPLFTIVLGWLFLRERLTGIKGAALVLGMAGAYLIVFQTVGWPHLSSGVALGSLVFVAGLALEACYTVLGKASLSRTSPVAVTSGSISVALLAWVPLAWRDVQAHGWPAVTLGNVGAIAYIALGCTVFGYLAWFY
ncbi:MAG TPA: DMT family transporter, partial [bacterium]|nr:DMT family transporter [bacterium]